MPPGQGPDPSSRFSLLINSVVGKDHWNSSPVLLEPGSRAQPETLHSVPYKHGPAASPVGSLAEIGKTGACCSSHACSVPVEPKVVHS